jgi:hypothetical protein
MIVSEILSDPLLSMLVAELRVCYATAIGAIPANSMGIINVKIQFLMLAKKLQ